MGLRVEALGVGVWGLRFLVKGAGCRDVVKGEGCRM